MLKNLMIGKKKQETPSTTEAKREPEQTTTAETLALEGQTTAAETPPVSPPGLNISSQPQNDEPSHFDDLIEDQERVTIRSGVLPKDEWSKGFIALHGMGAAMSGIKAIALPNERIDEATALQVAETFYDMLLEIPMLHFMLQPGGKWLGRVMIINMYAHGMRMAIGAELHERRNAEKQSGNFSAAKRATQPTEGEPSAEQAAALGV